MSKEDRATVTGNMHKKFDLVKIVSMVPEISWQLDRQTDRQTDRPTDRDSPHNTLKPGEVKKTPL